jgi:hypothetical protein
MATVILLDNDVLTRNSILGGNIDIDKLMPAVKAAQLTDIKPLLGQELYDKICEDYLNDELTGDYLELYEDYIVNMLIYASAAIYIGSGGAYQITNMGILKGTTDNSQTVNKNEVDYLYNFNKQLFNTIKQEFLQWIKDKDLPEYKKCKSTPNGNYLGGWYLKKKRN